MRLSNASLLPSEKPIDPPWLRKRREEATRIEENGRPITIIATGPLTSGALASEISRLSAGRASHASRCGSEGQEVAPQEKEHDNSASLNLYFYDSISPIVEADSIDMGRSKGTTVLGDVG